MKFLGKKAVELGATEYYFGMSFADANQIRNAIRSWARQHEGSRIIPEGDSGRIEEIHSVLGSIEPDRYVEIIKSENAALKKSLSTIKEMGLD